MDINTDMGEGYGALLYGADEGLAPHVDTVSIACGFHGGDPATIARTVDLAARHGLKIGAHPSLPDRAGFGRREMNISGAEVRDIFLYQIGALKGFLDARGLSLSHVKPHGKVYTMSGRDEALAEGVTEAAAVYGLPVFCVSGHKTKPAAERRGLRTITEFYVDLALNDDGSLIVDKSKPIDLDWVAARAVRAVREGLVDSVNGRPIRLEFQTIGVHNDTPNPVEVARAVRAALISAGLRKA